MYFTWIGLTFDISYFYCMYVYTTYITVLVVVYVKYILVYIINMPTVSLNSFYLYYMLTNIFCFERLFI